jgi:peroxiredoxin Q/BCP
MKAPMRKLPRKRRTVSIALVLVALAGTAHAKMLKVGEPFPSWKLPDHTGATVSSADLAGKTYLLWYYPKAMTPGCTLEGQKLRDRHGELTELGLTVYGVSYDKPETNAEFVKQESFPFALLSDHDATLATQVGAASARLQPVSSRVSYLIGPEGNVIKAYEDVDPSTHAAEVARDLRDIAAAKEKAKAAKE